MPGDKKGGKDTVKEKGRRFEEGKNFWNPSTRGR